LLDLTTNHYDIRISGKVLIISINLQFFNIEPNHNMWHPPKFMKLNNIYEKYANED